MSVWTMTAIFAAVVFVIGAFCAIKSKQSNHKH